MSLQDQQNFLARLYTDAELRRSFLSAPEKIGSENLLSKSEIVEIAQIVPDEVNFFADSLVGKRRREIEKFLPLTKKALGKDLAKYFREFSNTFNPQTVKKHLEDAFEFCKYLQNQEISDFAKNVAKFEQSKLLFFGFGKRVVVCKLDFDIRVIDRPDTETDSLILKKRRAVAIWLRIGKKTKHLFI